VSYEHRLAKKKGRWSLITAVFVNIVVAHTGQSSQLFLSRPAEMLSFLQQLSEGF
jgi:hypothetical protein